MIDIYDQRLRRLRRLSTVPRWTVVPTLQKQSVAEHSFSVIHIALWVHHNFYGAIGDELEIMYYAMIHDELEAWYGDLPSPANKQHMPNKHEFEKENGYGSAPASPRVQRLLKIADLLEAYAFCMEEKMFGNDTMENIMLDIRNKLLEMLGTEETFRLLYIFSETCHPRKHPVMEME